MLQTSQGGESVLQNGVRRLAGKLGDEPYAAGILVKTRVEQSRKGWKMSRVTRVLRRTVWKIGTRMKAIHT
jgi:hypothetical protein